MSGGSYNYEFDNVEREYVGAMYDIELNELMKDLIPVLHDLEWWQSCDIGEEDYRKTVASFKKKWICGDGREERLMQIINEKIDKVRDELMKSISTVCKEDGKHERKH